jgi:hypothetical protein
MPKASVLFLLGAGFDIDANHEAGPVINPYYGTKTDCGYPLIADILQLCFGRNELPAGKSIEQLFAEAKEANDIEPMERLVDRLMEADHYLARRLAIPDTSNAYRDFFEKFSDAHFLTFNYDSLPEIYLHHHGRWYPEDGYGVPVKTELRFGVSLPPNRASTSLVLHLHGSACVFAEDFVIVGNPLEEVAQLVQRTEPLYAFDAHAMSDCFPHYGRVMLGTGFVRPEERVIAPVPDKTEDLKQHFIRATYARALQLVRDAGTLVAIGYSFNVFDRGSYHSILEALGQSSGKRLFVVSPEAKRVSERLSSEYPNIKITPIEKTFGKWAAASFNLRVTRSCSLLKFWVCYT